MSKIQRNHAVPQHCQRLPTANLPLPPSAALKRLRALSTAYNDTPERASRPFDSGRDGFVMGEGAGIFVLEEREAALARGAKIYAEVRGYGLSGDGHHVTQPHPEGVGAALAMRRALHGSGVDPSQVRPWL